MNKSLLLILLLTTFGFVWSAQASEQLVIVVNKNNPVTQMSRSEIIDLFLGKYVAFPNGTKAEPVELQGRQLIKQEFYAKLVGMSLARINAYWARLRFTGRTSSAVLEPNPEHVIEFVGLNKQAIGYIPRSMVTNDVRVVFALNE